MHPTFFKRATNTIFLICFLIFSFSSNPTFAYPNTNASFIMDNSFGSCGGYIQFPSNCTDCHTPAGSFTPTPTLTGNTLVERNQLSSYTLSTNQGTRAGFNLTTINSLEVFKGTLSEVQTDVVLGAANTMLRHSSSSIDRSWPFSWRAPGAESGAFRMCYCVNSVDNNADGDYDNTTGEDGDNSVCGLKAITVNNKPVAVSDSLMLNEDATVNDFNPVSNDTDTEFNARSFVANSFSGHTGITGLSCSQVTGLCSMNAASYFALDTDDGTVTVGSFTYRVKDSVWDTTGTSTGTVTVRVTGQNDLPIASGTGENFTVNIGATFDSSITALPNGFNSVLDNDIDVDIEDLDVVIVANPTRGTLVMNAETGTFSYTNFGTSQLDDSFQYRVTDDDGTTLSVETITVVIDVLNTAPTANTDSVTIDEGASINIDVLFNDSDTESVSGKPTDVVSIASITNALSVIEETNHTVTFTHDGSNPSVTGNGFFTYQANDGFLNSATAATVTITVNPVNDNPLITAGVGFSNIVQMTEDLPGTFSLSLVATDEEDTPANLTWSIQSQGTGIASVTGTGSPKSISYTPLANNTADDSFIVRVTDTDTVPGPGFVDFPVTVKFTAIDDPPIIIEGDVIEGDNLVAVSMSEDGLPTAFSLTLNASEADGDAVNWSIVNDGTPLETTNGGNASVTAGAGLTKLISYTPPANFNGVDSFQVSASEGDLSDTVTVNVTVQSVDDAPVIIGDNAPSTTEDVVLNLPLSATDAEGGVLTWSITSDPVSGSAVISGTGDAITVIYTPNLNFTGGDTFTVQVQDSTALSGSILVNVDVVAANDPPVIAVANGIDVSAVNNVEITMSEDNVPTAFSLSLTATDVDSTDFTWSIFTSAQNGTASASGSNSTQTISYLPNADFNGTDTFVVRVATNAQSQPDDITVNVIIDSVEDDPAITGGSTIVDISEDNNPTAFDLTLNATDGDGGDLTWSITRQGTLGVASVSGIGPSKAISYSPNLNANGQDSFDVTVTDTTLRKNTITVTVNISAIDDAPVISQGDAVVVNMSEDGLPTAFALILDATDLENNPISWTISSAASNGNATVTTGTGVSQVINYSPNPNFNGVDNFTVRIAAGGQTDTIQVTVNVNAVNDAPVIDQGESITINISEDNDPTSFALNLSATDAESSVLTWRISVAATNGVAAVSAIPDGNSQVISYTPNSDFNGEDNFSVQVSDGVNSASFAVTVNISAVNDAPVITEGSSIDVSMSEDGVPVPFSLTLHAFDVENDDISWSIDSTANNGTASISLIIVGTSQVISYIPNADFSGSDSFIIKASDAFLSDSITVNVAIDITNDAPTIASIADVITAESVPMTTLIAVGSDVDDSNDGTQLSYSLSNAPSGMTISNDPLTIGQINWTPPQTGEIDKVYGPVIVTVADGGEDAVSPATTTFSITVKIPDRDSDQVADYNDFCPDIADSSNADNDGDGTAGDDFDPNDNAGGDACDTDDDNDGMTDSFEISNNLDPLNASDAIADTDGDGISNLDEFLAGTNPLFAELTVNASGYFTSIKLLEPAADYLHLDATDVRVSDPGPYRPGAYNLIWTASNATNSNLFVSTQKLNVIPLVSFSANQKVVEGSTALTRISLNGPAVSYPVTVSYSVRGSSGSNDHNAVSGSVQINEGTDHADLLTSIIDDGTGDTNETLVFRIDSVSNAAIGSKRGHQIRILEGNIAPQVEISFLQKGIIINKAFVIDGAITIQAQVTDQNSGQTHTYNWTGSDNALLAPSDLTSNSYLFSPVEGVYGIELEVVDSGSPAARSVASKVLKVVADTPPLLTAVDTDQDGFNDEDEGYGDSDNDGVPDYLDANSDAHFIVDQSDDLTQAHLLQTEQGLRVRVGKTARAAGVFGAAVTDSEITKFGGRSGTSPLKAQDTFEHLSGVYDFELNGVESGTSGLIVIPLQTAIPKNASFRKFDVDNGWQDFFEDGVDNIIYSASGDLGVCPEPGSELYVPGLQFLHNCVQLLIQDGGPNDQDGQANGVIKDPATIGIKLKEPESAQVRQGGMLTIDLLLVLIMMFLYRFFNGAILTKVRLNS